MQENTNTVILTIDGMMCPHCEATVKSALEALDFVRSAEADHTKGSVSVELSGEFDERAVKSAIEEKGYVYGGVK